MRVLHEIILPTANAAVTQTSLPGVLAHAWGCSVQAIFTGSPVGTLTLYGSSDPAPDANYAAANYPVVNWTPIAGSAQAVTGAGTVSYDVWRTAYNWIQAIYVPTSGSGTVEIQFVTKGF